MTQRKNPLEGKRYTAIHGRLAKAQALRMDAIYLLRDFGAKELDAIGKRTKPRLHRLSQKVYDYPSDVTMPMLVRVFEVLAREEVVE